MNWNDIMTLLRKTLEGTEAGTVTLEIPTEEGVTITITLKNEKSYER